MTTSVVLCGGAVNKKSKQYIQFQFLYFDIYTQTHIDIYRHIFVPREHKCIPLEHVDV